MPATKPAKKKPATKTPAKKSATKPAKKTRGSGKNTTGTSTPSTPPEKPATKRPTKRTNPAAKKTAAKKPAAKTAKKPAAKRKRTAPPKDPPAVTDTDQLSEIQNARRPPAIDLDDAETYERHKERSRNRQAKIAKAGQDIGPIPAAENPKRRAKCERNLDLFFRTYFPDVFAAPWSRVHTKLISLITMAVLMGCMLAVGIPRGFGKTSMCVRAVIWAIAYRHHTLVMLFAATNEAANELITDIQTELTTNQKLIADFPEICIPLIELGSANQKGRGQRSEGELTNVKRRSNELWTGDVMGRPGACIWAVGITAGGIRGKRRTVDGRVLRPTLGLADDCQTRSSAMSTRQINRRKNILQADLPGLPGQACSWSLLSTWTVIEPNDVADWVLNRELAPDYHGLRECFLDSMPDEKAMEHWQLWNDIRIRCQQQAGIDEEETDSPDDEFEFDDVDPLEPAHEYYDKHRKEMHSGAKVVWEHAYDKKRYRSALEKAMHWYFRDPLAFWSELQNDPGAYREDSGTVELQQHKLQKRMHRCKRGTVPDEAEQLVAHADVSKNVLWYEVRAFAADSTSYSIEYGTWPPQPRTYFTQANATNTIDKRYHELPTWSLRCMAAIRDLFNDLFSREWMREDGTIQRLAIAGIDANDETETVRDAIKKGALKGKLWPMHSRSFRPPKTALNDLPKKDGDVIGPNWRRRTPATGDLRYITYDTDLWKTHHRNRLIMLPDAPGSITWFQANDHRMIADHHVAEYSQTITRHDDGRSFEIWALKPGEDNHLWDVGIGCDVLGSVLGCRLPTEVFLTGQARKKKKKPKTKIVI